ncbi:hypothetical protein [Streptomyces sp. NPDC049916]|uniref:hypothetical protein n=1 Tax=unclassified Streptomyces TaxID=2593676 RepID=UPI0034473EF9
MAVSISLLLLLVILAVVFLRNGLKVSHALVCALLGFFLAGTSVAPSIHDGVGATAHLVSNLHP